MSLAIGPRRPEQRASAPSAGTTFNYLAAYSLLEVSACVDCGVADLVVLEFDHVGVKRSNVCQMAREGSSLRRLLAEMGQCEVRCGNCHRRRTTKLNGSYRIKQP